MANKSLYEYIVNGHSKAEEMSPIVTGVVNTLDEVLNHSVDVSSKISCINIIAKLEKNYLDSEKAKVVEGSYNTFEGILGSPNETKYIA